MKSISIFNDVLGPVMRGPSSSHTAASFYLAKVLGALLGEKPARAEFVFDPDGSYGRVYREQGSDLAFAAGFMGWSMKDERFPKAMEHAASSGLKLNFSLKALPDADHPNTVKIELIGKSGKTLHATGKSTGGGSIEINKLEGWPVLLTGKRYAFLVEVDQASEETAINLFDSSTEIERTTREDRILLCIHGDSPIPDEIGKKLEALPAEVRIWRSDPIYFVKKGSPLFSSAQELVRYAEAEKISTGDAAQQYEAQLLGLPKEKVMEEMLYRIDIMAKSVEIGLEAEPPSMQLLNPTAGKIHAAEAAGKLAAGGMHTRAAARAMAAMHVNCGMGVVCAAPTAGSAGVLPAIAVTLQNEMGKSKETVARAMLAAAAVGVILAERATFAAEIAGCQVEIGAAGAMAAAAVVDAAGGATLQAMDAAAISFQNTMGSVCDLVQGIVEIPCHTRNAVAASSAFVCADLILGGYENSIPLDETIDAVYSVGKMLPQDLKVTARGGLAITPSAKAMKRLR
ncbi:MAG: L-serine ammonia-lyase, iron-sulfur-dependent, subunit alpha [Planctomycetota bacterium]|jgi:L-serine dehydratase